MLAVEMLKVPEASPPVPTMSTSVIEPDNVHPGRQLAHHPAAAAISGTVSPFMRRPIRKPRDLRRGRPAGHDGAHDRGHLLAAQVVPLETRGWLIASFRVLLGASI
jgi:hypothetical protein